MNQVIFPFSETRQQFKVIDLFLRRDSNDPQTNPLESIKTWKRIFSLLMGCVLIMQSVEFASRQIKTVSDR